MGLLLIIAVIIEWLVVIPVIEDSLEVTLFDSPELLLVKSEVQ
jgi:hypothetical protein